MNTNVQQTWMFSTSACSGLTNTWLPSMFCHVCMFANYIEKDPISFFICFIRSYTRSERHFIIQNIQQQWNQVQSVSNRDMSQLVIKVKDLFVLAVTFRFCLPWTKMTSVSRFWMYKSLLCLCSTPRVNSFFQFCGLQFSGSGQQHSPARKLRRLLENTGVDFKWTELKSEKKSITPIKCIWQNPTLNSPPVGHRQTNGVRLKRISP